MSHMGILLPQGEVHIWIARMVAVSSLYSELCAILSDAERQQAAEFCYEEHRRRSVVCRGLLRLLLSAYSELDPHELTFSYGRNGKPFLCSSSLRFNISHSLNLGVFAVARDAELGVDLEYIRALERVEEIVSDNFAAEEAAEWSSLPVDQQIEAFYNYWTCKEAYLKAIGIGLSGSLKSFRVCLQPGTKARLVSIEGDPGRAAEWALFSLTPATKTVGALAIHGHDWVMRMWNYSDAAAFMDAARARVFK